MKFILSRSVITDIDEEVALLAAEIKENETLAGVDALIYACAKTNKTKLLTINQHFYGKKDNEFLEE